MLENEQLILKFAKAEPDAKAGFITGSKTASMEAAVINTLGKEDNAIVINGGGFGQRCVDILSIHEIKGSSRKVEG